MSDGKSEFWATFSIYDFRTPRLRQALVLVNKIIVPVPDKPISGSRGNITAGDIDRLEAEVDFLQKNELAIRVPWNKDDFDVWREANAGADMALLLEDPEAATRAQVQEIVARAINNLQTAPYFRPTVMPVYADEQEFSISNGALRYAVDAIVLKIVCNSLPMPADDEELSTIVSLRDRPSFKVFMPFFREWQERVALGLLEAGDNKDLLDRKIRIATLELQNAITKFKAAFDEINWKKRKAGLTLPLVVGGAFIGDVKPAIDALADKGEKLLEGREAVQKWWRPMLDKEFALAGVICEAQRR